MRNFVTSHKEYKFDSVVTEEIWSDLVVRMDEISKGRVEENFTSPVF